MTPSFTCPHCGGTYVGYRDRAVAEWLKEQDDE